MQCMWDVASGQNMPQFIFICVDLNGGTLQLGERCTKFYECASGYCYPDVKDGTLICQANCLPENADNWEWAGDCCNGGAAFGTCI